MQTAPRLPPGQVLSAGPRRDRDARPDPGPAQAELGLTVRVFCVNHAAGRRPSSATAPVEVTRFGRRRLGAKLDFCPEPARRLRRVEADILHLHVPNPTMILALLPARPRQPAGGHLSERRDPPEAPRGAVPAAGAAGLPPRPRDPADEPDLSRRLGVPPALRRPDPRLPMGIDLQPYLDPSAEATGQGRRDPRGARPRRPALARRGPAGLLQGLPQRDPRPDARPRDARCWSATAPTARRSRPRPTRLGRGRPGRLPRHAAHYLDIVPYYLAADAFWFPSNARSEAFGLVQVEAMASGCPVINTAIPHSGVPWVSPHEETGLTVPVDDPVALADAADRLLDRARPARPPRRRRPPPRGPRVRPPRHGRAQPGHLPAGARPHGRRGGKRAAGLDTESAILMSELSWGHR